MVVLLSAWNVYCFLILRDCRKIQQGYLNSERLRCDFLKWEVGWWRIYNDLFKGWSTLLRFMVLASTPKTQFSKGIFSLSTYLLFCFQRIPLLLIVNSLKTQNLQAKSLGLLTFRMFFGLKEEQKEENERKNEEIFSKCTRLINFFLIMVL